MLCVLHATAFMRCHGLFRACSSGCSSSKVQLKISTSICLALVHNLQQQQQYNKFKYLTNFGANWALLFILLAEITNCMGTCVHSCLHNTRVCVCQSFNALIKMSIAHKGADSWIWRTFDWSVLLSIVFSAQEHIHTHTHIRLWSAIFCGMPLFKCGAALTLFR